MDIDRSQQPKRAKVVDIKFRNIGFSVSGGFNREKKHILRGINGRFPSGNLIGIMGPSGAGKSSLLNIISGFQSKGYEGEIYINELPRDLRSFKNTSCYITQDNDLNVLLTVEENMRFAADLKLGKYITDADKCRRIKDILVTLGLEEVKATRTSALSGGQMKRLSVALELLSNPTVLFLDEPTTGLDSFGCHLCLKHLRKLAKMGKTIICTIHQPSDALFKMFDLIYVMASGKCCYQGNIGNIIGVFEEVGVPCKLYYNPADHVIEIASGDYGSDKISAMIDKAKNGQEILVPENIKECDSSKSKTDELVPEFTTGYFESSNRNKSNVYELGVLIRREALKMRRNMSLTHLRLFAAVAISIAMSSLFWRMGQDASHLWSNYNMILAFVLANVLGGTMLTILVFPTEFKILKKEHFNRYFSIGNYFTAITLVDIPLSLISCIILTTTVYTATGQPLESHRFLMFFATALLVTLVSQSLGLFLGSAMDVKNGVFVGSYIHFPLMLVSGFGLQLSALSPYFYWASYTSYLRYAVNSMAGALYRYNRTKLPCPEEKYCLFRHGDKFLDEIGVEEYTFTYNASILFLMYLLLRSASYITIKIRV